jgi:chromosome segregation ATPase
MTVEIPDKLIALLAEVDELKSKEAQLNSEKQRHSEQIAESEGEVSRCNDELGDIRENQLRLKRAKWTVCVTSYSCVRRKPSLLMMRMSLRMERTLR